MRGHMDVAKQTGTTGEPESGTQGTYSSHNRLEETKPLMANGRHQSGGGISSETGSDNTDQSLLVGS